MCGEGLQGFCAAAEMDVVGIVDPSGHAAVPPGGLNNDEAVRALGGEIAEEESVGKGEYRRDGGGAETDGEHGGGGECQAAAHTAQGVADVLEKRGPVVAAPGDARALDR